MSSFLQDLPRTKGELLRLAREIVHNNSETTHSELQRTRQLVARFALMSTKPSGLVISDSVLGNNRDEDQRVPPLSDYSVILTLQPDRRDRANRLLHTRRYYAPDVNSRHLL